MANEKLDFPFRINFLDNVRAITLDVESVVSFEDGAIVFRPMIRVEPIFPGKRSIQLDLDFSNKNLLRYG